MSLGCRIDQARLVDVGDVGRVLGADVNAGERAAGLRLAVKAPGDLGVDLLDVQALGLVLRAPRDVGLQVVPVPAAGAVEVGRSVGERGERGVEVARHVARGRGPEEHALGFQALVGRADRRRGTEEHGAREPLGERALPEQRLAGVDLDGLGVRAVDVGVDDGLPRVLQVLRQLGVHRRRSRSGSTPGMISGDWSSPTHSAWMTVFIRRSTPRVRWKRSRLDQSS